MAKSKSMWELLWDYDPNGLVVVDAQMNVQIVNPAFCKMFRIGQQNTGCRSVIGQSAEDLLGDLSDFKRAWEENCEIRGTETAYPEYNLYVKKVIFPVREENVVACILVDITHEWQQRNELLTLKREAIRKVNQVVDNQMHVAQQIAGLLGETTAETKVSLLKLLAMLEQESP